MSLFKDLNRVFYQTSSPGRILRETDHAFRALLDADHVGHEQVALLEKLYHENKPADFSAVIRAYEELSQTIRRMIHALERMAPVPPLERSRRSSSTPLKKSIFPWARTGLFSSPRGV